VSVSSAIVPRHRTLLLLANYHGTNDMVDVAVTERDRGQRSGNAAIKAAVPISGSPSVELGGSKGSESEVNQARTVKDHPANALNRLLDALAQSEDVATDLSAGAAAVQLHVAELVARLRPVRPHRQPVAVPVRRRRRLRDHQPRRRQPPPLLGLGPVPPRPVHRHQPRRPAPAPRHHRHHQRRELPHARSPRHAHPEPPHELTTVGRHVIPWSGAVSVT